MYADARKYNQAQLDQIRLHLPVRGVVSLVVPSQDSVKVENAVSFGNLPHAIPHPYCGVNSWIRCVPEVGAGVLTQQRGDIAQSEITSYISRTGADRIDKYQNGLGLYRERDAGEIEIKSVGNAYQSWDQYGNVSILGGMVEQHMSQRDLEHSGWAPTYRRRLFRHDPTQLAHEERFGVVKRPDIQKPYSLHQYPQPTTDTFYHEYSRWINDDAGKELVELQEGNVIDATAQVVKQSKTNRELRYRKTLSHKSSGTLTVEVDNELNLAVTNSSKATQTDLDFGAQNTVKLDAKRINVTTTGTASMTFGSTWTAKAPKVAINSSDVGFGANPVLGVAIGTTLQSAVLEPMMKALSSSLNVVSTDPGLVNPASRAALTGAATALSAIAGQLSQVVSKQVKLSG